MAEKKNPKIMPNNIEAEQSLLGSMLIDDNVALEVLSKLSASDFYYTSHKTLFDSMYDLQREGKPIDIITLSDKLTKAGVLENVGGIAYLTELTNVIPSSANYMYYFDIVKKNGMLRKIIGASNEIIENTYDSDNADMALAFAEKTIFDISDTLENKELIHINDTVNSVIKGYEDVLLNPECNKGQLSHFKNLDKITNGYKGGQMIVLAARPGCGKTSFAMNIVCNIARNEPEKVIAVFNLEMSISELTQRILLTMASVPHESVQNGASAEEFKSLWKAKEILGKSNIYIDDTANTTAEQIMSKCRKLKQLKKRLDFVVIDYLQLLKSQKNRQSIQQEVTEISRSIKIMAKELDVPVFTLSQTSRDLEKRDDGDPKLSDLRESGAIEQDADQVYFLVKPKNQENNNVEVIDLAIIKHRSGPCGKISFKWEGNMVKFTPITIEEARNIKQQNGTVQEAIEFSRQNQAEQNKQDEKDINTEQNDNQFIDNSQVEENQLATEVDVERIPVENLTPPPTTAQGETTIAMDTGEPDWDKEFDVAVSTSTVKTDVVQE